MKTFEGRKVKALRVPRELPLRTQRLCGINAVPRRGAGVAEESAFDRLLGRTRSLVMTGGLFSVSSVPLCFNGI